MPQLNAGCTNCFGAGDVTIVKKQVGAFEELEAESSQVELEPLRGSLFGYTWVFALVIG